MNCLTVLTFLVIFFYAEAWHPLDFKEEDLKNIWTAPQNAKAVNHIAKTNGSKASVLLKKFNPRIVKGFKATPGAVNYQIFLLIGDGYLCGGSMIKRDWVLSAAHCVYDQPTVTVYMIYSLDVGYTWRSPMLSAKIHEEYNDITLANDIALLKTNLNEVIKFEDLLVYSLHDNGDFYANVIATTCGFGRVSDRSTDISMDMKCAYNIVITNVQCKFTWDVDEHQMCVDTTGGVGACQGDSGGPVTISYPHSLNGKIQIGIVSYGADVGCEKGYPNVYTRVGSYADWITTNAIS
ncbi:CLUMA_CG005355, isoform A [Clunio marinus]|uniref:CLUMA_CG005355, isoform A n=1 Tax=Clunio marinus TaxID=568069 RepID=A0A1J1HUM3_9DIPT|nr:CLUMA_CG005355, isoform A [Clunio marinus]